MAEVKKTVAVITEKKELKTGIFDLWLECPEVAKSAKPGQFLSVYMKEGSRLLPRPISICEISPDKNSLRIVFRIAGNGTKELSGYSVSDSIEIMGPLGNGFTFGKESSAILIGGGIGIPPMLELAKQLTCETTIVLGYRDAVFLKDEFAPYGKVVVATEDGSEGIKGNVVDAMKAESLSADMIFACGPTPMLRGVKAYAKEHNITAQISMEEKMACGIGACLACVCKSKDKDAHSNVHNKRVCKDGPVFYAEEIEI